MAHTSGGGPAADPGRPDLWLQVIGKIRIARTPLTNHWWNTPLYLAGRGLTTSRSRRSAPPCPGGVPNCGPHVMHEAYSQEVSS
ncbi:DUF5996 family protein [Saccharomonospora cyanea]|uniref:DUF5996 family protein n=1 Tax=Saccharomonospora cyanea TaxID=40989 RepID=UPI0002F2DC2B|nr:DUF5996 family protein [Saccharomonospora cyanea]